MISKKTKYLIIGIVGIALLSLYYIYNPSVNSFFPKCPFHSLTGYHCPGCGSQRAIHQILHFNILGMINHNALFIVGILIILYHNTIRILNHYSLKKYYNYIYHPKTPMILGVLIILFWILRNIPIHPFSCLAPGL